MSLRLDKVSFFYEQGTAMEVQALKEVSATIPENSFVGLIGHTGSGKSTLVQLLNGLLKPSSGTVFYDDIDIASEGFDRRKLRADVGLVFQYPEHQLFETDVLKDVMFGPKNLGLSEQEAKERAREALTRVGLPAEVEEQSPFELSGGQKRRAAIAGVLAMQPKYLVLDEPTAGLDPRGRTEILDMIATMQKSTGMSVVLVSHSMEDVARYVDRILVMHEGLLVYDDVPKKIFTYVDELERMGLAAPEITYLLQSLKEAGFPVETEALTVEEAAEEIMKKVRA